MKKLVIAALSFLLCLVVVFTACKKTSTTSTENTSEPLIQATDQSMVSNQVDETTTDASTVVENVLAVSGTNGPLTFFPNPVNATITYDTLNAVRTITITYNGANSTGTRTRTGVITISIAAGVQWKTAGAQLTINYNNLKSTRVSDGKSITLNGTKIITNVSGGLLRNLASVGTITHTITSSNMLITFDDGTQRSWQIARQRVFTYKNGIVITITGTHTDGSTTGICEWGTNRLGNAFVTQIITPIVIKQECNFQITSGQIQHSRLIRTVNVTFGLDATGATTTSCPAPGSSYYLKIAWVNVLGNTSTALVAY